MTRSYLFTLSSQGPVGQNLFQVSSHLGLYNTADVLVRSELKPLLELKGEMDALDKLERMLVTVERRWKTKRI